MIRVLVVDDSPFFRRAITRILEKDPEIKVIGVAKDGEEAVEKVLELSPDVVTLDVEMPRKDGLEALKEIMEKKPTPVIMVSALTTEGAEATIKALELGAIDFIPKGVEKGLLEFYNLEEELISKVKSAKGKIGRIQKVRRIMTEKRAPEVSRRREFPKHRSGVYEILSIGSSTGGPPALQTIFSSLDKSFKLPVVVAQHMPPLFTKLLAERLNSLSPLQVKEAEDGEPVENGVGYIAPGGKVITIVSRSGRSFIKISDPPPNIIFKPSVDLLYKSVAEVYGPAVIGVILTGMGHDGCEGAKEIKKKGGVMIAQDEHTCVVYGMPRCVVEHGLADYVLPLQEIPDVINNIAKK